MKRQIGKTGQEVFAIGLGGLPLSIAGRPAEPDAIKVIHAALDAGVNFIDTANVYCIDDNDIGHNEKLIAKAIKTWPSQKTIFIATKGGLTRPQGRWEHDGNPKNLRKACEQSLRDLNIEQIFLYQLHWPSADVFTQQVAQLAELQKEGKIKYIGISNVDAAQIKAAQQVCRVESVQNKWNPVFQNDAHNGVFDACKHYAMSYIAYSPVGGGESHQQLATNKVLSDIATKHGVSTYQVMLAWALAQGDFVLPIPGASRVASITDSVKAASLHLTATDVQAINNL